jgi:serine/threonine protein kinase
LKPANILINGDGWALISDFGTACCETHDSTLTPDTGTIHYAAPELFYEDRECTTKVDVFSFGSILYEILLEKPVFEASMMPFPVMRELLAGRMPPIPEACGGRMQNLIRRCWSMKPECRPSFDAILGKFGNNGFDIVPGAERRRVGEYVEGVSKWETVTCSLN